MASPLRHGLDWLRAPAIELAFLVRSTLRWSRGAPELVDECKRALFAHLPPEAAAAAQATADELVGRFALQPLAARSSRSTFAGSLAQLLGLQRLAGELPDVPSGADGVVRAVDVGCGDFHYASALAQWLSRHGAGAPRPVVLRGIELDGHGIYRDGRSRADHGKAHAALATLGRISAHFQVGDFRHLRLPEQDVVTMFFPFVSAHACLRWGAPVSRLAPRRLLARAVAALRPGGWLLVVNQTLAECQRVHTLLGRQPVERLATASWQCGLVPWHERTVDQVGSLWRRLPA